MGFEDTCPACDINLSLTSSKFLNCLHSFCAHCLRKIESRLRNLSGSNGSTLSSSSLKKKNAGSGVLGNILCPKCHGLTSLTARYGIEKLPSSNFIYRVAPPSSSKLRVSEPNCKLLSRADNLIQMKLRYAQRCKIETGLRKSRFLTRINNARDYLEGFVSKSYGSFDSKKLSLLKQMQKIRLRVVNALVSKLALLEQCEGDLKYLSDLTILLKKRSVRKVVEKERPNFRRSAAPVLLHKNLEEYSSKFKDNRLSLATQSALNKSTEEESNFDDILTETILPNLNKRLDSLGATLERVSGLGNEDPIAAESSIENPRIVYIPEDSKLFEKVVCELPILVVDGNNIPIVGYHHFQDLSAKFIYGNQESVPVEFEDSGSCFKIRFVPPCSCWGQIVIENVRMEKNLMISPTKFEVKPLLLDVRQDRKLKTLVI